MLQALLPAKITRWLTKNPWQIEDLLTAVVFGSCEYAGIEGWKSALHPFLAQAVDSPDRKIAKNLGEILPVASEVAEASFEFWPGLAGFQQRSEGSPSIASGPVVVAGAIPEIIITLKTSDARKLFVLVEVKLNVGKSSGPASSPQEVGDQLAKYWEHLKRYANEHGGTALAAVYVTPWSFPSNEMRETRTELTKCGDGNAPMFWVSWRDFVLAVENNAETSQHPSQKIILDVCRLLKEGWGFVRPLIEPWPTLATLSRMRPMLLNVDWSKIALRMKPGWFIDAFVFIFRADANPCETSADSPWHFVSR